MSDDLRAEKPGAAVGIEAGIGVQNELVFPIIVVTLPGHPELVFQSTTGFESSRVALNWVSDFYNYSLGRGAKEENET